MAFIPPVIAAISAAASSTAAAVGATTAAATAGGVAASTPLVTGLAGDTIATVGDIVATPIVASEAASPWLGYASLGATALSGAVGAAGAIKQGNAEASAAKYNAGVAETNAAQATQNALLASQAGSEQGFISSQRTRSEVGSILANQGASGVDVNSGSALDVRSSARELGELDALTVRSNATRQAYGYQTTATSEEGQAKLDKADATSDLTAGYINSGSTLLGSAGTAATNFAKYQLAGGFSG